MSASHRALRLRGGAAAGATTAASAGSAAPEAADAYSVTFKRKVALAEGEALYVVGDCAALGDMVPEKAIAMKPDKAAAGPRVWSATVGQVPMGARYSYLAADPSDLPKARPLLGYKLQLHGGHAAGQPMGEAVADDTTQLVRFEVNKGAGDVRVTGSSAALGGWDYDKALKLQGEKGNKWQAVLAMPSDEVADFEYKYVADGKHEEGPNRKSDVYDVEPAPEMGDDHVRVSNLKAVFNGMLIRFLMFHPLQHKHERMCITGGHPSFGSWGKPEAWCRMGLGGMRTLLTNELGRCWEATFPATPDDVQKCAYRYIIVDDSKNTAVWENEPNRFIETIPGAGNPVAFENGFRRREWTRFDGNFVAKELAFDWVPPNMFIGPYPSCEDDVKKMQEAGVTGVVNVQTDTDITKRMINMAVMRELYAAANIELRHIPIEDFHGESLAANVKYAGKAVHELSEKAKAEGREPKVYIHCTAGMGRAPATACIYLVKYQGYNLDDARNHVKHHRPIVAPNYEAMKLACQNGLDC